MNRMTLYPMGFFTGRLLKGCLGVTLRQTCLSCLRTKAGMNEFSAKCNNDFYHLPAAYLKKLILKLFHIYSFFFSRSYESDFEGFYLHVTDCMIIIHC